MAVLAWTLSWLLACGTAAAADPASTAEPSAEAAGSFAAHDPGWALEAAPPASRVRVVDVLAPLRAREAVTQVCTVWNRMVPSTWRTVEGDPGWFEADLGCGGETFALQAFRFEPAEPLARETGALEGGTPVLILAFDPSDPVHDAWEASDVVWRMQVRRVVPKGDGWYRGTLAYQGMVLKVRRVALAIEPP